MQGWVETCAACHTRHVPQDPLQVEVPRHDLPTLRGALEPSAAEHSYCTIYIICIVLHSTVVIFPYIILYYTFFYFVYIYIYYNYLASY